MKPVVLRRSGIGGADHGQLQVIPFADTKVLRGTPFGPVIRRRELEVDSDGRFIDESYDSHVLWLKRPGRSGASPYDRRGGGFMLISSQDEARKSLREHPCHVGWGLVTIGQDIL